MWTCNAWKLMDKAIIEDWSIDFLEQLKPIWEKPC